jgi:outer membrane lipoprotein-sorting protein
VKQNATLRWGTLLILALLSLQPGCASKIPLSLPLAESEKPFILNQLQEFQSRNCIESLDADVTLEWEMYGKTKKIPGMLQLQAPSFLRYSVVDPLGRQLFILVSDGNSFSLVDNSKAKALTGQVNSNFWKKYIPSFITSKDYISWLTGRLPAEPFEVKEVRRDKKSVKAIWLITGWKNTIRHHVLFFPETGQVTRHIVEGENKDILLDVMYTNYDSGSLSCAKPLLLKVEGTKISGTVKVHFDEILPETLIPPSIFHLNLPAHFTVKIVE